MPAIPRRPTDGGRVAGRRVAGRDPGRPVSARERALEVNREIARSRDAAPGRRIAEHPRGRRVAERPDRTSEATGAERRAARRRSSPRRALRPKTRADIQGLRAVAVLLVVAEHLTGWPRGGFVGVDVFFVISGFLITGILLREHQHTGRISFAGFYRRRIRRIVPAATLVLVVTAALSWLVYPAARASAITLDGVWAFFFAGNYRFAVADTDYFAATAGASPLQHYWSLAVEEQFYLVWPVVMLVVLTFMARAGWRSRGRVGVGVAIGVVILASLAWGLHETGERPAWAYFSTLSRAWELGLGALLAICTPLLLRIRPMLGAVVTWTGLLLIVSGAYAIGADQGFPVPGAILPVVGSALVIAGGTAGPAPYLWPLTNRAMTYVGDISYSLYLWHFPAIVLLAGLLPTGSFLHLGTAVVVTAIASVTAYHCFENAIHHSRWLEPRPHAHRTAVARTGGRSPAVRRGLLAGTSVALTVLVVGSAIAAAPQTEAPASNDLETLAVEPADDGALAEQRQEVAEALLATTWPTLEPSIDTLGRSDLSAAWVQDDCLGYEGNALPDPIENAHTCVYGDETADRTMAVYGDSMGVSWVPALEAAFGDSWRIEVFTARQCTFADVAVRETNGGPFPECAAFRADALADLAERAPDVLVVSSAGDPRQVVGAADESDAMTQLQQGAVRSARDISGISPATVYLPPPPVTRSVATCRTAIAVPADCISDPAVTQPWADGMRWASQATEGGVYVDVRDWFCVGGTGCPAFVGGTPVTADGAHLTDAMATRLGPVVREVLARAVPALAG